MNRCLLLLTCLAIALPALAQDSTDEKADLKKAFEKVVQDEAKTPKATSEPAKEMGEPVTPVTPTATPPAMPTTPESAQPKPAAKPTPAPEAKAPAAQPAADPTGAATTAPRVIFLVDRSASMVGHWRWVQVDVVKAVYALQPGQLFQVVMLGPDRRVKVSPNPQFSIANEQTQDAAVRFVIGLMPTGNTEPTDAIDWTFHLLTIAPPPKGAQAEVRFHSDGMLANPQQVLKAFADNNKTAGVPVSTFLYGNDNRRALRVMRAIADQNGGTFHHPTAPPPAPTAP